MEKESFFLLVICLGLIAAGIVPIAVGVDPDALSSGGCETCFPGLVGAYSAALIILGAIIGGLFCARHFFGMDISFMGPANARGAKIWLAILAALFFIQLAFTAEIVTDDPYSHFLNALNSWGHPMLFLDLFHKPVYNFFGALVAPLGFFWYRLLFLGFSVAAIWLVYLSAKKISPKHAWVALILAGFSPVFFLNSASGLSEALFAFLAIAGFYFYLTDRLMLSSLFISLMPFTRFEGIFFIAIWFALIMSRREYKALVPLLAVPTIIWLGGALAKGDLWWVFTQNQNLAGSATYTGDKYPNGPIGTYFEKFYFTLGAAGAILFQLGILKVWRKKEYWPVLAGFFAYFILHVYSWSFGSFGAMGLEFLMSAIVPLGALIAAEGFGGFIEPQKRFGKGALALALLFMVEAALLLLFAGSFLEKGFAAMFLFSAVFFSLIVVACFAGFAGADGVGKKENRVLLSQENVHFAAAALLVVISIGGALLYAHPPLDLNAEHKAGLETANWIKGNGLGDRPLLSSMGFVLVASGKTDYAGFDCEYEVDERFSNFRPTDCMYSSYKRFSDAKIGTILIVDQHYSWLLSYPRQENAKNGMALLATQLFESGYRQIHAVRVENSEEMFLVFEKVN
ncbi:MAG: hypothetical protein NUV67_00375 [archaeon]|nr:hypothetical protein [archaeon]